MDSGTLYVISTPIGNLEDITLRALRILKEVDCIAAEDTRHTGILLKHFDIKKPQISYHDFNKKNSSGKIIQKLLSGESIGLVTDAGTPGISDPAYMLVKKSHENKIPVMTVPGATAAIAGLSISGLPSDRFTFEGFLPVKKGRKTRLEKLVKESRTMIFYESPHRLLRTLNDLNHVFGNREISVCRELTKKFEETIRGKIEECINIFENRNIKGEFTLIVSGNKEK